MIDLLGDHRSNDTDIIRHFLVERQIVTDELARLSMLGELGQVSLTFQFLSPQLGNWLSRGIRRWHGLTIESVQFRLVIEGFEVRWPTGHAQKDDAFGFRKMMRHVNSSTRVDLVGSL